MQMVMSVAIRDAQLLIVRIADANSLSPPSSRSTVIAPCLKRHQQTTVDWGVALTLRGGLHPFSGIAGA
jgi:hypothetical protein